MKFWFKSIHFHSRKCIWNGHLQNGHLVSASNCICIWIDVLLLVFESKLNKIFVFVFVFEKSKFLYLYLYLYLIKRIWPQPWPQCVNTSSADYKVTCIFFTGHWRYHCLAQTAEIPCHIVSVSVSAVRSHPHLNGHWGYLPDDQLKKYQRNLFCKWMPSIGLLKFLFKLRSIQFPNSLFVTG